MTRRWSVSALAAWELVGKEEQQHSNLRLKLAQSVYDRTALGQRYENGTLEVHNHVSWRGISVCLLFTVKTVFGERDDAPEAEVHVYRDKFPMLVGVRKVTQNARPLASTVRLKLANDCGVFVANSFEARRPMSREALLRILNRELSAALGRSRVSFGDDVNEIVESRAQVVDDFSNHHTRALAQGINDPRRWPPFMGLRVYVCENTVFAQLDDLSDKSFEIRQVFACPFSAKEGALKFIHEVTSS